MSLKHAIYMDEMKRRESNSREKEKITKKQNLKVPRNGQRRHRVGC